MVFQHFITSKHDPLNDKSPLKVEDRYGNILGHIKSSWPQEEILKILHDTYEQGILRGRENLRYELRSKLGL